MLATEPAAGPPKAPRPVFDLPWRQRLLMVLLGYLPFLHLVATLASAIWPFVVDGRRAWAWSALGLLYLVPPLASRLASWAIPRPDGRFEVAAKELLQWWFHAQWQVIFNRLPFLEELLRLVPGLYSAWLRLWGARIGPLVYWSSGVTVLDRGCLEVGGRVVFGAGAALSTHVLMPDDSGRLKLLISPIVIGSDTLVGGYAVLSPGTVVAAGELLPAFSRIPPFTVFKGGRRERQGSADWLTAAALVTASTAAPGSSTTGGAGAAPETTPN